MTKSIIAVFAITSILLTTTLTVKEVYGEEDLPMSIPWGGTGSEKSIPDWVDQNFRWYAQEQISQTELINSLEFLVTKQIILLPSAVQTAEAQEITQSMEELQLRIDRLESLDDEEFQETIAILEWQAEIFEGGPESLKGLASEGKPLEACGKINKSDSWPIKVNKAACKAGMWLVEKALELADEEEEKQIQVQALDEEIKKAELAEFDEPPSIPAGATGTYVKYHKGTPENLRLTVECDRGDVATGGGFAPGLNLALEHDYFASMPYPANWANNPRMNNPTGWTYVTFDSSEARVWVVCLDLTPSAITGNTIP